MFRRFFMLIPVCLAALSIPALAQDKPVKIAVIQDSTGPLQAYAEHLEAPLACANLCASLQGETFFGIQPD